MGIHRSIVEQILLQGGDYLMTMKESQPIPLELVENMFMVGKPLSVNASEEKGHGRQEFRECSVLHTKLPEQ